MSRVHASAGRAGPGSEAGRVEKWNLTQLLAPSYWPHRNSHEGERVGNAARESPEVHCDGARWDARGDRGSLHSVWAC